MRIYDNKAMKNRARYYHYPKEPSKRKNEWGEYSVPAYDEFGKRVKDKDYLTEDYDEAVGAHKNQLAGKKFNIRSDRLFKE